VSFITPEIVPMIKVVDVLDERKPFKKIYTFTKNNLQMTRQDFMELSNALHEYLGALNINYGVLLTADGSFVFTENKVKFNPLLVKLATGINYGKAVGNAQKELAIVNDGLVKKGRIV
jgi:hypothetical protein